MRVLFMAFLFTGLVAIVSPPTAAQEQDAPLERRMRANEASAVASLRTINVACVMYSVTYGIGFPAALKYLGTSGPPSEKAASLIGQPLADGVRNGYSFTYTPGKLSGGIVPTYTLRADPLIPGLSGRRHYFTDQSGVIRWNASATANEQDPPIDRESEYTPKPPAGAVTEGDLEANEAWAVAGLRTITTACITYAATYGTGFPATLRDLGPSRNANAHGANLIDETLASGTKDGYVFVYRSEEADRGVVPRYTVTADPVTPGQTGRRYFFTDQSGVVRSNASATASASDPPIEEPSQRSSGVTGAEAGSKEGSVAAPPASPTAGKRVKISRGEMEAKIIQRVVPAYPPLARAARIMGTVRLHAIIGTDGTVESLEVISGHPLLVQSAIDAVRQWKYKPTLLNGEPVEVETFVDVEFVLDNVPK